MQVLIAFDMMRLRLSDFPTLVPSLPTLRILFGKLASQEQELEEEEQREASPSSQKRKHQENSSGKGKKKQKQ
jgi:hypothetical protein